MISSANHPSSRGTLELNTLPSDVLRCHILTHLDGASLASLSCTCTNLYTLCSEESIWRERCLATWPSTTDERVEKIISTFPTGHHSFFSDSFPFISYCGEEINLPRSVATTQLISAVDVFYKDELIFSRVHVTETVSGWFFCSPMRVDLIEPKESILSKVLLTNQWEGDLWKNDLEKNLSLSWILIDPTSKRAVNVSTRKPVSVDRHWLTGEVHLLFSTILADQVEFKVTVVMCNKDTGETGLREVSLVAEDMEGRNIGGRGGMIIWAAAMRAKRRHRAGGEEKGKEKYRDFMNKKTSKKEMKLRKEKETAMETAFEWRQPVVEIHADTNLSQKHQFISDKEEAVKEKIIMSQERHIQRLNELVRSLQLQLVQCKGENSSKGYHLNNQFIDVERKPILDA